MRKRILSLVLSACLLLGLCACGQSAQGAPTWQEQYDLGIRYLSEGNYEEAIIAFTAAIEIDPKQADAYIGLADVYSAQGETEKAIQLIEDAISTWGADADPKLLEYLASLIPQEEVSGVAVDSVFGTLDLSDLICVYKPNSRAAELNEGAVAGLEFAFTVNGPTDVCDVYISGWNDLEWGYTQEIIDEEISMMQEIWKNENVSVPAGQRPPFSSAGLARPVYPEEVGQTQQNLLIGLDENINAVGYAVVTVTIPG